MTNVTRLSPEPPSSTIDEVEVTTGKLASILASAVIENSVEEGYIYATDGLDFPVWISIDLERKLLRFFTYVSLEERVAELPSDVLLVAVNKLNEEHIVVQFHLDDKNLCGNYWMTFDSGLDPRHYIKMLRRFSGAFTSGGKEMMGSLSE